MTGDGGFLVEDFINAITSQLDRVQDALRIKAVNRPLTYALRDLSLDLKVFVVMDEKGNVRLRTGAPNEQGASTLQLGFTTITKPMIEENTISLATTRSASLDELGLAPEEQQKLERVGVRNLAQLQRLGNSAGVQAISRLADVPPDQLRRALVMGKPKVSGVHPDPVKPSPRPAPAPPRPPVKVQPPVRPAPPAPRPSAPGGIGPPVRPAVPRPRIPGGIAVKPSPSVSIAPGTKRLALRGTHLLGEEGPPQVRLNAQTLNVLEADDDRVVIEMPDDLEAGALEVEFPGGDVMTYSLDVESPENGYYHDGWAPEGESL